MQLEKLFDFHYVKIFMVIESFDNLKIQVIIWLIIIIEILSMYLQNTLWLVGEVPCNVLSTARQWYILFSNCLNQLNSNMSHISDFICLYFSLKTFAAQVLPKLDRGSQTMAKRYLILRISRRYIFWLSHW